MVSNHTAASCLLNEGTASLKISGSQGLSQRRPPALSLKPINTGSTDELDASTSSSTSSKTQKYLNIGFSDLTYSVNVGIWKKENRNILQNVDGEFRAGDLTAIMGPSGAGKTSLLNILAGYKRKNIEGKLTVNGRERDSKKFRRQTAYIMQDHEVQPLLTIAEAMHFSANLKIGDEMTQPNKKKRIKTILEAIGLYESRKTRAGQLSGGQKKRLAIALELVNNPPVMFFDEPTSGLDSSTSTQCVSMLRKLAAEGRTIVCTIHQPSGLVFEMFDHLYTLAEGRCIYTGSTGNLLPFLKQLDLVCPAFHNPSDYLLEIATNDHGYENHRLTETVENGKNNSYRKNQEFPHTAQINALNKVEKMMATGLMTPVHEFKIQPTLPMPLSPVLETPIEIEKPKKSGICCGNARRCCKRDERYSTSFYRQFFLLLMRTFLIARRDRSLTTLRILMQLTIAPIIGSIYFGIGNDASHTFNNFRYAFFSIMFVMWTAFSSMTLAFPLELPILAREHFNRWYSLRAYYIATTIADFPIQVFCVFIYITITYFMTAQPLEFKRFGLFLAICLMASFVAQSLGIVTGCIFNVKNASIFGPFFICPFLIFSGFFIHLSDAHPVMHWLFHISFLKYSLEGASQALFGYNRPKMECNQMYCHYIRPDYFLKTVDMDKGDFVTSTIALVIIFTLLRVTAFYIMLYRLKRKR